MRFLHLADLHIGKALHKQNLLADQRYILQQILEIARTYEIDAVLIAGDIYQRNVPSDRRNLPCDRAEGRDSRADPYFQRCERQQDFGDRITEAAEKCKKLYFFSGNNG